jgi:hypothetical protein
VFAKDPKRGLPATPSRVATTSWLGSGPSGGQSAMSGFTDEVKRPGVAGAVIGLALAVVMVRAAAEGSPRHLPAARTGDPYCRRGDDLSRRWPWRAVAGPIAESDWFL